MRFFTILFVVSLLVAACGGEEQAPPPPNPPNASSGKWPAETMQSETTRCASKGTGGYSRDQWLSFCGCVYEEASKRWTYEDFKANFQDYYYDLKADKVIKGCADRAGIAYQG